MHQTGTGDLSRMPVIAFGADYNPEQWPREVWLEDVRLMKQAHINLVTIGVFSWATIEPREGERDFTWLDELIDLLWDNGISVDLATPIASPPPWMGSAYPETLAQWSNGQRTTWGSRNHFSPASAKYREFCSSITHDLVQRYAAHPAVVMWHVGNEFGQLCYGDESAARFRTWLQAKYGTLDALNDAWGTAFWSQTLGEWEHVIPPRDTTYLHNPAQELDFKRYSSDLMLEMYLEQVDVIRSIDPTAAITTNFMGFFYLADYHSWAPHVDIVADDIYPDPEDPHAPATTALTHELMRSLGRGKPWMLMEQAITTVNWRAHNIPKTPAQTRLESLSAIARGSRGVCFFQWRASAAGSERFHSALLPHAGEHSDVHRAVRELGAEFADLSHLYQGEHQPDSAPIALVFDWASWWVTGQQALPSQRLDALTQLKTWHRQLWLRGLRADVVAPDADLSSYAAVLAPSVHLLSEPEAHNLTHYVTGGGQLVVGAFSAVADHNARIGQGKFPSQLTQLLGVGGQEWIPLPDATTHLPLQSSGTKLSDIAREIPSPRAHTFVEKLDITSPDTQVHLQFDALNPDQYALAGRPVVTSRRHGRGAAWYVGALLEDETLGAVLETVALEAELALFPHGLRNGDLDIISDQYATFLLNYSLTDVTVSVAELATYLGRPAYSLANGADDLVIGAQDAQIIPHLLPTASGESVNTDNTADAPPACPAAKTHLEEH